MLRVRFALTLFLFYAYCNGGTSMNKNKVSYLWLLFCFTLLLSTLYLLFKQSIFTHYLPFFKVEELHNRSYYKPTFYTSTDCSGMIMIDVEEIDQLIKKELEKYPKEIEDLQYQILLCNQIRDKSIKGMYLHSEHTSVVHLVLQVDSAVTSSIYEKEQFIQVLHHELFHVLDFLYLKEEWHDEGYFIHGDESSYDYTTYISPYAQNNSMEDRAETFKYLMWEKEKDRDYFFSEKTKEKAERLKEELKEIFTEWEYLEKK